MAFEPRVIFRLSLATSSSLVMYKPLGKQRKKSSVSSMFKMDSTSKSFSGSRISAIVSATALWSTSPAYPCRLTYLKPYRSRKRCNQPLLALNSVPISDANFAAWVWIMLPLNPILVLNFCTEATATATAEEPYVDQFFVQVGEPFIRSVGY